MAKGYLLKTDSLDLQEMEFHDGMDIAKAIGCGLINRTRPKYPISMEQLDAFPRIDIWCDDIGAMNGSPPNLDNVDHKIYGNVVLLGHKMTEEGEDMDDLSRKDAEILLQRMCHTPERQEAYERRQEEIREIRKFAVMTDDCIVTAVAFDIDNKTGNRFTECLKREMDRSDESFFDRFKAEEINGDFLKNGLVLPDGFYLETGYKSPEGKNFSACIAEQEDKTVPGRFDYYVYDDDKGFDVVKSTVLSIDGNKLAGYMKEKYGLELNPKAVEYGRACDDGKFRIACSDIRPVLMLKDVREMRSLGNAGKGRLYRPAERGLRKPDGLDREK